MKCVEDVFIVIITIKQIFNYPEIIFKYPVRDFNYSGFFETTPEIFVALRCVALRKIQ